MSESEHNASAASVERVEGKVDALGKIIASDKLTTKSEGALAFGLGFLAYRGLGPVVANVEGTLASEIEQTTAAAFIFLAGGILRGGRWLFTRFFQEG